jgi:hypothetical protein
VDAIFAGVPYLSCKRGWVGGVFLTLFCQFLNLKNRCQKKKSGASVAAMAVVRTQRQSLLLRGVFDLVRDFFYQDGGGVSSTVLEGGDFLSIRGLLETSCAPTSALVFFPPHFAEK